MSFRPQINDTLQIDGAEYRFTPHPVARDLPYGQQGRRATVYQVEVNHSTLLALKVFTQSFRSSGVAESASRIRPYASVPGLQVCARLVITPKQHASLLEKHPDLKYACLMPWVMGATWQEVIVEDRPLTEVQSLELSFALVRILATMEQKGLAHCDLSGPNIILPGLDDPTSKSPVALVDVEEMYGTTLSRPEKLSAGSPGYAHKAAARGIWNVHADRFAGAIILAEMLCWCDEEVRKQVYGEQFFDPDEIHQDSERYRLMKNTLGQLWGTPLSNLFERTWHSNTLEECPNFIEWGQVIFAVRKERQAEDYSIQWKTFEEEITPPLEGYLTSKIIQADETSNSRKVAESMLVEAGKMEHQGRVQDAINLYRSAKALLGKDDPLYEEIELIVFNLSESIAELQGQSINADTPTTVEQPVNAEKPSQAAKRRKGKSLSILTAGGILAALFVMFYFGNNLLNNFPERIDFMVASLPTATATISVPPKLSPTIKATSTAITPAVATLASATSTEIIASPTQSIKSSNILLFETTDDGSTISIVNLDNGKSEKIFSGDEVGYRLLSPSKSKVAFSAVAEGKTHIQIYDLASRNMSSVALDDSLTAVSSYYWMYPQISWSLDDTHIGSNFCQKTASESCEKISFATINTLKNEIEVFTPPLDSPQSTMILWSPNSEYVAQLTNVGTHLNNKLNVYDLSKKSKKSFDRIAAFEWLDTKNLLIASLDIDATILEIRKINFENDTEQMLVKITITRDHQSIDPTDWAMHVNSAKGKAVIYRTRGEYIDLLWLDFSGSEVEYIYKAGQQILWAGWTKDSLGVFLSSEDIAPTADFPGLLISIPELLPDGENMANWEISPSATEVAVLLCPSGKSLYSYIAAGNCSISVKNEANDVILITEPQPIYVRYYYRGNFSLENDLFSWSLDGSSLAYIVQQDGKPMLAVLDVKNNKQRVIAEVSEDTKIIWLP